MVLKLAWRNIWRQRTRTMVIIGSIAVGIWAGVLMTGFAVGMVESYLSNAILDIYSHIQIHHPDFKEEFAVVHQIPRTDSLIEDLNRREEVKALSARTVVSGMISSARSTRGIKILGIVPEQESDLTRVSDRILEGEYLDSASDNRILISKSLNEKLGLSLRSKLVLTFQDISGEITAAAFRIAGVFETSNQMFDDNHVFVLKSDMDRLITSQQFNEFYTNEIALLLEDKDQIEELKAELSGTYPDFLVESYRDLSPDLSLYESQIENISLIYIIVIMLALIFGIINTMLMAVLERIRELGMLMAIGMTKIRIFSMIVSESIYLALIAVPFGLLLSYTSIRILSHYGINLEQFAEGARRFGMATVIYPSVPLSAYINIVIAVAVTSVIASLYPAFKAIRLNPVEAIRQM